MGHPTSPRHAGLPTARSEPLDGVRGLAAVIVMLHHALLAVPALALPYYDAHASRVTTDGFVWAFIHTPLHIVWDGTSAVYLFFVLSGYVLTWQVLRKPRDFDWLAYYPSRVVRLYVPVWAAIVFAGVLVANFGLADDNTMTSLWTQRRPDQLPTDRLLSDATLLGGAGFVTSPLWSLQWEMWFSLLLPVFVFIVRPTAGVKLGWVAIAIALGAYMFSTVGGWEYMVMFLVGAALASAHRWLAAAAHVINSYRLLAVSVWVSAAIFILVLFPAQWTVPYLLPNWPESSRELVALFSSIAASGLVIVMALHCPLVSNAFSTRGLLWFGKISFSLYLVHEPIVIVTSKIFGEGLSWIAIPLGIAISVFVGWGFYYVIEKPSHKLSKSIRDSVSRRNHANQTARHRAHADQRSS